MNYFEIINRTLIEMNYLPVSAFSDLTSIEHKRLMNIINRLNKEICSLSDNFSFRQMIKKIILFKDKSEYNIRISGKISKVIGKNVIYEFEPDYTKFYLEKPQENIFGSYAGKLLFPSVDDEIKIFYSTNDFVIARNDNLKSDFEFETDKSVIPDNFSEKLFINGAAYNFKQNTAHPKYAHWKQEYDKALSDLVNGCDKISGSGVIINGGYRKL